jgi:flagellar basal-body rod protein FlgG
MVRSLWSAATGMVAQQMNVDNIANNLANVNTVGFKKNRIEFQDLLYQNMRIAGTSTAQGIESPVGMQVGLGVRPGAIHGIFSQGNVQTTNNPLDMMVEGDGFFRIQMVDGSIGYTRDGSFTLNSEGAICTNSGYYLEPRIVVPPNSTALTIGVDGTVSVTIAGQNYPEEIGQLDLAKFINPAGLERTGRNLYKETAASGEPFVGMPGEEGLGNISQGFLETSNVQAVEEMVNMIAAQRAYEMNSKTIQTSDDMLGIANNLKR